jgi:hypothetical protein
MIIPEGEEGRRLASCAMIQGRYLYEEKEGYKRKSLCIEVESTFFSAMGPDACAK